MGNDLVQLTIRLDRRAIDELQTWADETGRKRSQLIEHIVARSVAARLAAKGRWLPSQPARTSRKSRASALKNGRRGAVK